MRSCGALNPFDDIDKLDEDPVLTEFVAQAAQHVSFDSSAVFTTVASEVVESIGRRLSERPTSWPLLVVQVASLWGAERLQLSFPGQSIRFEFVGIDDKREWLQSFASALQSGELSSLEDVLLLQKAVWSGLAHTQNAAVLVASGEESSEPIRAVRLGVDVTEWGAASLRPKSFVLQFSPAEGEEYFQKFGRALVGELEQYCCSDRTLVTCGQEIASFVPLSPRGRSIEAGQTGCPGLALGVWAFGLQDPKMAGIPLGRSFAKLDASGLKRQELTFGTFRTGLLEHSAGSKNKARSVIVFSHHLQLTESRIVWLSNGVEVCHQSFVWGPQELAVTLYLELPSDLCWDLSQQTFRWDKRLEEVLDRGCEDLPRALEAMVKEYNAYAPAVESSTLGCWALLALGALALGGLMSPVLGTKIALLLALVLSVVLMRTEVTYRHRKRYAVGQSLKQFAEVLEGRGIERLWLDGQMFPDGTNYP